MNRKYTKILAMVIATIFLLLIVLPVLVDFAAAQNVGSLEQQKKDAEVQKQQAQSKITDIRAQKSEVLLEKQKLDTQIRTLESKIDEVNTLISATEHQIQVKNTEIKKLELEILDRNDLLKNRIRVMDEEGSNTYFKILLSSNGVFDFLSKFATIREIIENDTSLIKEAQHNQTELENAKVLLENEKVKVSSLKNELNSSKIELNNKQNENTVLLSSLSQDEEKQIKFYEEAVRLEEELSKQIKEVIVKQQSESKRTITEGNFAWPLPGYTTASSNFGPRTHPITKEAMKQHNGVDLPAPAGTNIVAAKDGVVIVSDFNSGYGNYIVIDHGSSISTLYAHCSRLLVKKGEEVKKGQVIALVGTTGSSTGNHLHFEVRNAGVPTNPMSKY